LVLEGLELLALVMTEVQVYLALSFLLLAGVVVVVTTQETEITEAHQAVALVEQQQKPMSPVADTHLLEVMVVVVSL
jgi:predicted DNA-binding ArsR family transcriptional regulator